MSEPIQNVVGLICLIGVFALTRYLVGRRIERATAFIIRDLESREACDPPTAVELPYAEHTPLRIGMRNYHAKALEYMVSEGVAAKTGSGKYYLQAKMSHKAPPAAFRRG
jgi:hypothetical protein